VCRRGTPIRRAACECRARSEGAFDIGELGELDGAGAGARKPPSAVIHNDNSVIRNTNHILSAVGVEICHLHRPLIRERQRRTAVCVVTEAGQVNVDASTALAPQTFGIANDSRMSVRNGVTSLKLIDVGKATGTNFLLIGRS
jgi:hypothetical protein